MPCWRVSSTSRPAPVTANPTPYSAALYCLADYARRYNLPSPRMAVGRISDYTGTVSSDGGRLVAFPAVRTPFF